jgi:sialate O-acetylesterase
MIAPLTGFPIRGVIAWHGENDIEVAQHHRALCSAQIQGWRAAWRQPDLPFLFVQAIGEGAETTDPVDNVWAELRESQAQVARIPGTALVVAADRAEPVAPVGVRDPRSIAERLMLSALAVAYRRAMPHSGPVLAGHAVKNGAVHLRFDHAESGLRARAPGPLLGFAIAGADRVFRWGDARFENGGIIVSHPAIPVPVAVRYGWAARPVLSVENGAGLPAVPFRTDNWAGSGGARRG